MCNYGSASITSEALVTGQLFRSLLGVVSVIVGIDLFHGCFGSMFLGGCTNTKKA